MTLDIKPGVDLRLLQPQMVLAVIAICLLFQKKNLQVTITRGCEQPDSPDEENPQSLHYSGLALDFRLRDIPIGLVAYMLEAIQFCLGVQFDLVRKPDHFHLEFDPK